MTLSPRTLSIFSCLSQDPFHPPTIKEKTDGTAVFYSVCELHEVGMRVTRSRYASYTKSVCELHYERQKELIK